MTGARNNVGARADIAALGLPVDGDLVSIADAIADALKDDRDGTESGLAPDTRRRLQQALTAAIELDLATNACTEPASVFTLIGDIQDDLHRMNRLNAIAQWIESARYFIDTVRFKAKYNTEFERELCDGGFPMNSPHWDEWESAGLEFLHITISEQLTDLSAIAESARRSEAQGRPQ